MSDCLFCKVVDKKIPARIVYEDEQALAFEDINPQAPVHILVIPKKHIPHVLGAEPADNALMGHLLQVVSRVARDRGIADRGFRLVANTNPDSGQEVYHIHFHVLGGRRMHWPPG